MQKRIDNRSEEEESNEQAFIDAGFSVERIGGTVFYEREVSHDVLEASRAFSYKRSIGYLSKDITGRRRRKLT